MTVRQKRHVPLWVLLIAAGFMSVGSALVGIGGSSAVVSQSSAPKYGGVLTDLQPSEEWTSLDPETDPDGAVNGEILSAIYGQLFEAGPKGSIVPSEASSYAFSNKNLTLNIYIRPGITFSDGTPFNAAAVADSLNYEFNPKNACECISNFTSVKTVTAVGQYDVRIQLKSLESNIISEFIDEAPNWTPDPTALARLGATAYGEAPIGAGPFIVTSEEANTQVTMKRNPHYFVKGEPYLSGLKIVSTSTDQADLEALQSGQAQLAEITTPAILKEAEKTSGLQGFAFPAAAYYFIRFDMRVAPFNNVLAREAVVYATNVKAVVNDLFDGVYTPVQGLESPGQAFYTPIIPGYRAFDLAKAKKLVSEIPGGLSLIENVGSPVTPIFTEEADELAQQWEAAGMKVTINPVPTLTGFIAIFTNHTPFNAWPGQWDCEADPGDCDNEIISSSGAYSTTSDPIIDGLLAQGTQLVSQAARAKVYLKINEELDKTAEIVPMFGLNQLYIASSNVEGVNADIAVPSRFQAWEGVWIK